MEHSDVAKFFCKAKIIALFNCIINMLNCINYYNNSFLFLFRMLHGTEDMFYAKEKDNTFLI